MPQILDDMETTYQNIASQASSPEGAQKDRRFIPRSRLSSYLSEVRKEDIPWAVNFLVNQLAFAEEPVKPQRKHTWENYKLSPEIEVLSSFERKKLPTDYDEALRGEMEEKSR